MLTRDDVAQQALALSLDDRAYLAELLEPSLGTQGFASPEIGSAWIEEAERRVAAYEQGKMPADDWRNVMSRLEARLVASKMPIRSENDER